MLCLICSFCIPFSFPLGKASRKNQKWRGPDENIRANLRQYGLEKYYLDVLVSDASKPSWRKGTYFDAIITDRKFIFYKSRSRISFLKSFTFEVENVSTHRKYQLVLVFSSCRPLTSSHSEKEKTVNIRQYTNLTK